MPTKAQQLLLADGLPAAAIIPTDERAAAWKGRKLTKPRPLQVERKVEDPGTLKLLAERAARDKAAKKAKRVADKESRIIRNRRKAKPEETTMNKKAAKKTARKARVAKTKPAAKKRTAAKKAAQASARTPAATGRKAEVAALMRRPEGVTTAQIKVLTGMLDHSARALISGIAKGLDKTEVVSKAKDGNNATVYAIRPAPAK